MRTLSITVGVCAGVLAGSLIYAEKLKVETAAGKALLEMVPAAERGDLPQAYSAITIGDYEVGVPYTGDVGWIESPCAADDYSAVVDWGEGLGWRVLERNTPIHGGNGIYYVPPGRYNVWDKSHAFASAGVYNVVTSVRIHCVGAHPGTYPYNNTSVVRVHGRVPVNKAAFSKTQVRRLEDVVLSITISADAPPVRDPGRPNGFQSECVCRAA